MTLYTIFKPSSIKHWLKELERWLRNSQRAMQREAQCDATAKTEAECGATCAAKAEPTELRFESHEAQRSGIAELPPVQAFDYNDVEDSEAFRNKFRKEWTKSRPVVIRGLHRRFGEHFKLEKLLEGSENTKLHFIDTSLQSSLDPQAYIVMALYSYGLTELARPTGM